MRIAEYVASIDRVTAYRANFGRDMITCGTTFKEFETLGAENTTALSGHLAYKLTNRLEKIHKSMEISLRRAYERNQKQYNKTATNINYEKGETVWRRNFVQSNAGKRFAKKFAPRYIKSVVVERKGSNLYILSDSDGKGQGTFHAKDIKKAYRGGLRGG